MRLSIITPAFNEAADLPMLYERLAAVMANRADEWEWLVVDDHSGDGTFAVIEQLALRDARIRGVRLARNSGSHLAITCGLHQVSGDAAALLAADLQDPPELLPQMLDRWRNGAQVVWAVRRRRPGERHHQAFAAIYYWIMRRLVGLSDMPARGADSFLIDRVVIDAFCQSAERNASVFALITWLGFRQDHVEYRQAAARARPIRLDACEEDEARRRLGRLLLGLPDPMVRLHRRRAASDARSSWPLPRSSCSRRSVRHCCS